MAPAARSSRPTKRAKVSDTRSTSSSGSHVVPDIAPSSQSEDSQNRSSQANIPVPVPAPEVVAAAAPPLPPVVTAPVPVDIGDALLSLSISNTIEEAIPIIKWLEMLNSSPDKNCQELFDAQGLGILSGSLFKFKNSEQFVNMALNRLRTITLYLSDNAVCKALERLKFLDTVVLLAETHTHSSLIQEHLAHILENLVIYADLTSKVQTLGTEQMVQVVLNAMDAHPDNMFLVKAGFAYCSKMSQIPVVKEQLLEQGAVHRLGAVFWKYRQWNNNNNNNNNGDDSVESTKRRVSKILEHSKLAITELMR